MNPYILGLNKIIDQCLDKSLPLLITFKEWGLYSITRKVLDWELREHLLLVLAYSTGQEIPVLWQIFLRTIKWVRWFLASFPNSQKPITHD